MDYVRALRTFSFPHVNATLEFVRYNKGNADVDSFLRNIQPTTGAKVVDFAPRCAAYVYIGKLTKGVKRSFAPAPVSGYTRQFALVSGEGVALRADGEKVRLVARTDLATVSDATGNVVTYEAKTHSLLVVHYFRTVPYIKVVAAERKATAPVQPVKPTSVSHGWRIKPTAVGVHAPLPQKPAQQKPAAVHRPPPTDGQVLTSFGLFFNKGGGDETDAIILRKGVLFNRALNVPVRIRNTFVWAKIWDEASRRRGYFYVKDEVVKFFPVLRGRPTIEDFILNTLPGSNVALPVVELWCMRQKAFVPTTKGWCWYNHEGLRKEILRRRCFSSSFSVGFIMHLGFRMLKATRIAGTNILHITSYNEERFKGWKSADVYLPNVPKSAVVAGDRTRVGGEILASVANALNQEEVYSSVVSSITNRLVLRDQSALLSHLDTKLCDMFSQRDAMIREKPAHRCDVFLKPHEKEKLRELFPELSIQFSDSVRSSHPYANAVRGCFNGIFSRRCGGVKFFDIGGSFTYHVKAGHVNCHVCNPVVDVKDVKRRINEILFLSSAGGDSYVSSDLLAEAASNSVTYCSKLSQCCTHKADAGFMVDVYDISPQQVAEAMDVKGCLVFDVALMFPVELLYGNGEVFLEDLDTLVRREGDKLSYSVGQCGEVYEHSFASLSGFFTHAYLRVSSGNVYKIEYEGYRSGYHHLTICRAQKSQHSEVTQRSIVPTFVGKSLVFVPVIEGERVSFKSVVLDTDFVDRIYSYALNTIGTFENRTFEYAVGAVRSQKTHVITGSRVVHNKVDISSDDMWALVVSVMAQAIKDRAKSIRSYNFIRASGGGLASLMRLFFQGVADCFSCVVSSYAKAIVQDNFNILATLVSMPKSFIVRVPNSVNVVIHTTGVTNKLELQAAFSLSRENFNRRLRKSRLRTFSRAMVEDSIRVMKNLKTEDGKPLPITEDSVYAFITGNMANVHCTRAGLLGGSKAKLAGLAARGVKNSGVGQKIFSGLTSFFSTGGLFFDSGASEEMRNDSLIRMENAVDSPLGFLESPRFTSISAVSSGKTYLSGASLKDFSAFLLENGKLISVLTLTAALAPVAWRYRREIAQKAKRAYGTAVSSASDVGLRALLEGSSMVGRTSRVASSIVTRTGASAAAVTRATVVRRQVPLAIISLMTSYSVSSSLILSVWAHVLPRHLMFFSGIGTLLGVRASTNAWTLGRVSNRWLDLPGWTWGGSSYRSMIPHIALGISLVVRGLLPESTPQLTYVPPIEGRNVYEEALRYYRDFDYDGDADGLTTADLGLQEREEEIGTSETSESESLDSPCLRRVERTGAEEGVDDATRASSVQFIYEEAGTSGVKKEENTVISVASDPGASVVDPQVNVVPVVELSVEASVERKEENPAVCVEEKQLLPEASPEIIERIEVAEVKPCAPQVIKSEPEAPKISKADKGKAVVQTEVVEKAHVKTAPVELPGVKGVTCGKQLCMFRKCTCGVILDVYNEKTLAGRFSTAFTYVDNLKGRKAVFFSKMGDGYSYAGGAHSSAGWPRVLDEILEAINFPSVFDHCLVQKYKQGGGVPFHADDEECYPQDNPILTVNLVGKANFSVKCRRNQRVMVISLAAGDYFLMPCGFQRTHLHSVTSIDEDRVSLTFRATRRVAGVGRSLALVGGVTEGKTPTHQERKVEGKDIGSSQVVKPQSKALSEDSGRDRRKRTTYSVWCEQDYVKKCEWLRAENPVLALRPDYTPMTFEVVKTGTTEDAVVEYMKYLAIGIERMYRSMMMARNIGVVTAEGIFKVPNQVYESMQGFHVYKTSNDLIFHPTMDGMRVRDLPYVFIAEKGIFVKGKDVDVVASLGDNLFVCDDTLVFHDAINLIGALKISRCAMVGEAFKDFEYKCYNAPPGGGKTTMLVNEFVKYPNSTAVITANVGSSEDINKAVKERDENLEGVNSATTVNSRVVNFFVRNMYKRVLVDEVYMMHQGLLQLGVYATGASEGLFFGDINQIPFINREKVFRMDCAVLAPKKENMVYTSKSYRCPLDVCYLLSSMTSKGTEKCYPEKVVSGKDKPVLRSLSKTPIGTTDDVAELSADIYLCMTQIEKSDMKRTLKGKGRDTPVMTVHEAQGKTFGKVVLFRTKKADDTLFTKGPHILVALSRHTHSLVYAALSSKLDDKIGTYISEASSQSVSDALLHTFAPAGCFRGL